MATLDSETLEYESKPLLNPGLEDVKSGNMLLNLFKFENILN